jgi:hypothetical protein
VGLLEYYLKRVYPRVENIPGTGVLRRVVRRIELERLEEYEGEPTPISELEWDVLIILDGCRLDTYREVVNPDAGIRVTMGSCSGEFVERNFSDYDFKDTICVTGNPHYSEKIFKDLTGKAPESVFHSVFNTFENKWDEENGTVLPEKILEDFKTAEKLFPEKRKILHFMQPHHPFVKSDLDDDGVGIGESERFDTVWDKSRRGDVEEDEVRSAYRENLDYVISAIKGLETGGKKVLITSDHGNFMGERGVYGHPCGSSSTLLRKVPEDTI